MPVHVRFRFNKVTGEVEEFLVDDQDRNLPEAEHDRIATDVGRAVVRSPIPLDVELNGKGELEEIVDDDSGIKDPDDKLKVSGR